MHCFRRRGESLLSVDYLRSQGNRRQEPCKSEKEEEWQFHYLNLDRLLGRHFLPLLPCVLAAPRWLDARSARPLFPDPSNAPAGRAAGAVAGEGLVAGRACGEVGRVEADDEGGEE